MHIVVDAAILEPTINASALLDLQAEITEWAALFGEPTLSASSPTSDVAGASERWWQHRDAIETALRLSGVPITHADLMRVLDTVLRVLPDNPVPAEHQAIVDGVKLQPDPPSISNETRDHLGLAAERKHTFATPVAVATRNGTWTSSSHIEVIAQIVRERLDGEETEVIRELLDVVGSPFELLARLAAAPCRMMECVALGVRAVWVTQLNGDPSALRFTCAPQFQASVHRMNYRTDPRYAAQLLRTMALVAAGELDAVEFHAYRTGRGGNNPAVRDSRGRTLQRGELAQRTPNAHRLYWWSGEEPEFLCVAGHDSAPTY